MADLLVTHQERCHWLSVVAGCPRNCLKCAEDGTGKAKCLKCPRNYKIQRADAAGPTACLGKWSVGRNRPATRDRYSRCACALSVEANHFRWREESRSTFWGWVIGRFGSLDEMCLVVSRREAVLLTLQVAYRKSSFQITTLPNPYSLHSNVAKPVNCMISDLCSQGWKLVIRI